MIAMVGHKFEKDLLEQRIIEFNKAFPDMSKIMDYIDEPLVEEIFFIKDYYDDDLYGDKNEK
jgi:hypothetical protein